MNATNYYAPAPTSLHTQPQNIAAAYRAFGLTPPAHLEEHDALLKGPTASEVARTLALDAYSETGDADAAAWFADAVEAIRDAQARDALRAAWGDMRTAGMERAMPARLEAAREALEPHLAKLIAGLEKAAQRLPAGALALDPEAALATNTGTELQAAREILSRLSIAASMHNAIAGAGKAPAALRPLLALVDVPAAVVEVQGGWQGGKPSTLNAEDMGGSLAIRALARYVQEHGADLALIAVARGEFEGCSLAFAGPRERSARYATTETAFTARSRSALLT